MRVYDSKQWIKSLFSFANGDTVKPLLPGMISIGVYSSLVIYLQLEVLDIDKNSPVKNITMLHTLLGFVLSLLLVFRTNTAYDRWWEGRKLLGRLVNDSKNLAVKLNAYLEKDDKKNRDYFIKYIGFFPQILVRHLCQESTRMELDQTYQELAHVEQFPHPPSSLVNKLSVRINELYKENKISAEQMILLDKHLAGFLETCGGCERIKNTPIPFSYSSFIKKFIVFYIITLPIGHAMSIGYTMIPITIFVFYVLTSLEIIAEEIEDPFNNEENDLPTGLIAHNIEKSIQRIFNE